MSKPWQLPGQPEPCLFNDRIDCEGAEAPCRGCSSCGWNPEVQRERVRKWQAANEGKDFSELVNRIRKGSRR